MPSFSTPPRQKSTTTSLFCTPTSASQDTPPAQLTPRSKIRALLDGFDDESEVDKLTIGKRQHEPITAPKGAMAARMSGKTSKRPALFVQSDTEDEVINGDDAYERIKKQLLQGDKEGVKRTAQPDREKDVDVQVISEDEEQITSAALRRRRIQKRALSTTSSSSSATQSRGQSPGIFVTPDPKSQYPVSRRPSIAPSGSDTDSNLPRDPRTNPRFLALVERKRQERLAKEETEAHKRAEKEAQLEAIAGSESDSEDAAARRKLTQEARPTRKASKKALEEIARETQRMKRNMQLPQQPKSTKAFAMGSFFATFSGKANEEGATKADEKAASSSSAMPSDAEGTQKRRETPPTSPPMGTEDVPNEPKDANVVRAKAGPQIRVHRPLTTDITMPDSDSDDLEIIPTSAAARTKKNAAAEILARLPAPDKQSKDSRSLLNLRALANLTSIGNQSKTNAKASMTSGELQTSLRRRAREQAAKEREERLQELKARGIIVQTAEERAKDQAEIEDLVEKARKEAEEIMRREKEAAKREGRNADEGKDLLDDDDSEDEEDGEWIDAVEDQEENEIELSGSEEDEDEDEGERNEDEDEDKGERNEDEIDDDDEAATKLAAPPTENVPVIPGLPTTNNITLGLTQAFAATMADSQTQAPDQSLLTFTQMPDPDFPIRDIERAPDDQQSLELIQDSQGESMRSPSRIEETQSLDGHPMPGPDATQFSELPDPTQDAGFVLSSPGQRAQWDVDGSDSRPPPSTVDTVLLSAAAPPVDAKKKGRLRTRRAARIPVLSDSSDEETSPHDGDGSAFDVMRRATAARKAVAYDKKRSEAKGMVEEQAEESDDEYAGLGGASDEGSGAEDDDEELQQMIDEGPVDVDESKLAALYADRERASDAQAVQKLFKDMDRGLLRRRKRGHGALDLSDDSEDDRAARRRAKQREFARMRRALLETDANVGKIAENPKKAAFLRAIEDRDPMDGGEDMDIDLEVEYVEPSAGESQETNNKDGTDGGDAHGEPVERKRKRILDDDGDNDDHEDAEEGAMPNKAANERLPGHQRRTAPQKKAKKPSTLAEIRETVSFLIEEPHAAAARDATHESSDVEEAAGPSASRSTVAVVDRISLKRAESNASSNARGGARLAFHDASASAIPEPSFKVPSLLRRATTQNTAFGAADSNHGVTARTERTAGLTGKVAAEDVPGIRRGGSKKSSIGYFARAQDAKKLAEEREKRRELGRLKARVEKVEAERKGMASCLMGGRFD